MTRPFDRAEAIRAMLKATPADADEERATGHMLDSLMEYLASCATIATPDLDRFAMVDPKHLSPTERARVREATTILAANAALRARAEAAEAEVERLKSMAPYVESSDHYCDGMTAAWTDAQFAEQKVAAELTELRKVARAAVALFPHLPKNLLPRREFREFHAAVDLSPETKAKLDGGDR